MATQVWPHIKTCTLVWVFFMTLADLIFAVAMLGDFEVFADALPNGNLVNIPEKFKSAGLRYIPVCHFGVNATLGVVRIKAERLTRIQNVFWRHTTMDVYQAISWDRLHAYHGGLFSRHIYKELLDIIKAIRPKRIQIKFEHQCVSYLLFLDILG